MKEEVFCVFDNWNGKVVFTGVMPDCYKYIQGNNNYQIGYSRLKLISPNELP